MKVVQTILTEAEHKLLEDYARRNSKTIKQALREAIKIVLEEGVSSGDPIFSRPPASTKTGKKDRGSVEHDKHLYGGKT